MASTSGIALVQSPLNVTGVLFNKTKVDTPLFNMIGRTSQASRVFITGAEFDTGYPQSVASGISETASLTAPSPEHWTRTNGSNVTQIFQRSVAVSYRKMANTADLNAYGVGVTPQPALVGNTNNVPNELAFQIANSMDAIRMDIENCILNGSYVDGAGDPSVADSTRGLIQAITTNVEAAAGAELSFEIIYTIAETIFKSGSPFGLDSYVTVLNFQQFKQLQKVVADEGLKISPERAGVNVTTVITPFGPMKFMPHRFMPNGTAITVCIPILRNMLQETPGKGNFFFEPLAKKGAADEGQIFGMWGLDHGPEWMHVKVTGLATTTNSFTAPQRYITNAADFSASASA